MPPTTRELATIKIGANIHTISVDDVLSSMGFPNGWKKIKRVSKKRKEAQHA